jgi:hypothetical protein
LVGIAYAKKTARPLAGAGGFRRFTAGYFRRYNMESVLDVLIKIAPYLGKIAVYIGSGVKELYKEKDAAAKLFKETAVEIYGNLTILEKLKPAVVKTFAINSPEIRRIVNKDLKTAYAEQCIAYTKKFPQLKRKDKKNIMDKLSLAVHKINAMRLFAEKTDKELQAFKGFRPAVRINNIREVYTAIRKILKQQ